MRIDTIRTLGFGAMSSNYAAIGTAATRPTRMVYVYNSTDVDVFISDNGVNDKFFIPTGSFLLLDLTTNRTRDDEFEHPELAVWYARDNQVAATSGAVRLTLIHD